MDIFIQCCTKKKAFCTCMHINVHRHSHRHRNLIENAAREFSESHCFMNSIYKVLAVSAALLVVSSGCAVVKVMAGCEKKKNLLMKSPQLPWPYSTTSHVTMRTAAMAQSIQWCLLNPKKSNTVPPHTKGMLHSLWHLSYSITQLMSCSHSHPCFSSSFFF